MAFCGIFSQKKTVISHFVTREFTILIVRPFYAGLGIKRFDCTSLSTTNVTARTNNLPKSVKPQVKASIVIFLFV